MSDIVKKVIFGVIAAVGACAFAVVALKRGETVNALWVLTAAVATYIIAYRFYSKFIATKVLEVNPNRTTPAVRRNDGLDYVPTNKYVVFGHHFAAIAGAGPLAGPVLAAQMGYLPGMLWLLAGVVLAGAVQDFTILFISTRRDGRSLGTIIRQELGAVPGIVALFGTIMIMTILLAVLALIVVKALTGSPWGTFTIVCTIPIAILMGLYLRYLRPNRVFEVSIMGFILLMLSIVAGGWVAASPTWAPLFTWSGTTLTIALVGYGFVASILPVWLLLGPRDYLSTFLKIGALLVLAIVIVIVAPDLKMPAITRFTDGTGPVWSGELFPFLFITIACGAVSGFHALIASGTTPKLIENESHLRFVGYGAMLTESFVGIMSLISASILDPGIYFAMNSSTAIIGKTAEEAARAISSWGFVITPEMLTQTAHAVGESTIIARAGGAPTLAVGMAHLLSRLFGGDEMVAFWYHFAILFEALFILTAVDAGTRAGRFMLQDLGSSLIPNLNVRGWGVSIASTALCVAGWGYFTYQGVVDPFGGINTLWPLFGISNQMLAAVALLLATVVLYKMKKERYAFVTMVPTGWLLVTTLYASAQKVFSPNPRIGFFALARKFQTALDEGKIIAPAKDIATMKQVVFANNIDGALTLLFMAFVICILVYSIRACVLARQNPKPTVVEIPGLPTGATR